jgi:hypothetical protein
MEMSVDIWASSAGGLQKGRSGRLLALEPAPRAARRGIDKQARSPRRLLEQPTEAAHRFNPIRLIEAQPLRDWGAESLSQPALPPVNQACFKLGMSCDEADSNEVRVRSFAKADQRNRSQRR